MKVKHPKKVFLAALIFIFLFSGIPVWAEEEGVVKGSIVNVRQGAGLNYSIVAKAQSGQGFTILSTLGDWRQVRLYNGNVGWIHKDFIDIKTVLKKVTVKGNNTNLRKGPGTGYAKAGQVQAGLTMPVFAEKNGWYEVQAPGIGQAWIAAWLTIVQNTTIGPAPAQSTPQQEYGKILTNVLNVRKGPGTNYAAITKIGLNEIHEILEKDKSWYKIKVGELSGWVSADYVQLVAKPASEIKNQPQNQGTNQTAPSSTSPETLVVTGGTVNIRQQGNLDSNIIAKASQGDRLTVTGRQGDWIEVVLADGSKGWIASWLTDQTTSTDSSRGNVLESEVLIAPIAEGKTFKIIDSAGRPVLLLEGWTNSQYQIRSDNTSNKLVLELEGPTERNYEGKNTRLGLQDIRIYPSGQNAVIELTFSFPTTHAVSYDAASKTTKLQLSAMQTAGLSGKVIVVDPGHASVQPGGWLDPGAIGKTTGLKEKDVNLSIALKLKSLLETAGARVIMTHTGQTTLSLAERAGLANSAKADIFVSIHANYSLKNNISGHTTYYYAPTSDEILGLQKYSRQKLASLVQRELVKAGGRNDMGALQENFAVLRETRVPSILVETAFLSDAAEESLLGTDDYRQKLSFGIFNGVKAYFE